MRMVLLISIACLLNEQTLPAEDDATTLVNKVIAAAGGKDKLLKRFRMVERYSSGPEFKAPGTPRTSVVEPPNYWWIGTQERGNEPAKRPTWAWTLVALTDKKSKIASLPSVTENGKMLDGLQITGSIDPPLDMYFDPKTHHLIRIDWRNDLYLFQQWKKHDGTMYPSKCTLYKRKTRQPWFHHEITELQRLDKLPPDLKRFP
ncbi:MAG: hypothetical protein VX438_04855 [Planctomycetota bacterium]|nr:hypothetical protein [Planctomycetota bacterium]